MGLVVVERAEQHRVIEVGGSAILPGKRVVDVAEGAEGFAGGVLTGLLIHDQRQALGGGVEAFAAAEVEDVTRAIDDGREQPGPRMPRRVVGRVRRRRRCRCGRPCARLG